MNWKLRAKAFGVHLMASVAVAVLVTLTVMFVWYPWPYTIVSGGMHLIVILLSVDVAIGPLLTFAVFNDKKPAKELRRDLAVIVVLQLAALSYGVYTVFQARPAVIAFEVDRFRVTSAHDVVKSELPQAQDGFRTLSWTGPRLITTAAPKEDQRLEAIMMGLNGADLGARPLFWRPWDAAAAQQALRAGKSVQDWLDRHPEHRGEVMQAIERSGRSIDQLVYLPLLAHRTDWSVLLDKRTGEVVGFAPIDA